MKNYKTYTKEDEQFIIDNYHKGMKGKEVAAHLGVSEKAIIEKAFGMRRRGLEVATWKPKPVGSINKYTSGGMRITQIKTDTGWNTIACSPIQRKRKISSEKIKAVEKKRKDKVFMPPRRRDPAPLKKAVERTDLIEVRVNAKTIYRVKPENLESFKMKHGLAI